MEFMRTQQQRKPPSSSSPFETPAESASTERPPNLTPLSSSTSETQQPYMMMPYPMIPPPPAVQLQGIAHPHPHDVLCGRGGQSNIHPGNTQWRLLVAANKELYVTLPKKQKMMLSQSIVNAVRSQVPSGRFLQKDMHNDLWYDVGDKRAQEKTSQALREGAPEIRDKLKAHDETVVESAAEAAPPEPIPSTTSSVVVGPPPLDPSPSQEQMPPPRTIRVEPPPAPEAPVSAASSKLPYPADDYAAVEPIPLPRPLAAEEAQASCSFGSIGLLSDAEQARLMNSFFPKSHDEAGYVPPQRSSREGGGYPPPHASYYPHSSSTYPPASSSSYAPTSSSYPPMEQSYYYPSDSHPHHHHPSNAHPPTASSPYSGRNHYSPPPPAQQYDPVPLPVDQGLEPVGLSIGSMMSIGTMGPPEIGQSFGSAMSYTVARRGSRLVPSAPDGGLQDVGMSLGSLSLADGDRERIIAEAERDIAALMGNDNTLPTLLHQQKSKGNLLECSDSEGDDEDGTSAEASAQRSQEHWNRMQATLAEHDESIRNNLRMPTTVELMPPRPGPWYPATSLDRDFSQMSAISVGEDFEPPGYHGQSLRFEGIPPGTELQFPEPEPEEMPPPLPKS